MTRPGIALYLGILLATAPLVHAQAVGRLDPSRDERDVARRVLDVLHLTSSTPHGIYPTLLRTQCPDPIFPVIATSIHCERQIWSHDRRRSITIPVSIPVSVPVIVAVPIAAAAGPDALRSDHREIDAVRHR